MNHLAVMNFNTTYYIILFNMIISFYNSFCNSSFGLKSRTIVTKSLFLTIVKRGMIAKESILKITEIKAFNRILYHNHQLLRNGPLSFDSILKYATNIGLINLKMAQHFLTVAYPNIEIPYSLMKERYPNLIINSPKQYLSWDDFLSVSLANKLQTREPFNNGKLHVLCNIDYDSKKPAITTLPNDISLKQTGQQNCDYLLVRGTIERCFDLKAGKIKPMQGHTYITSDLNCYNENSERLFQAQHQFFIGLGSEFIDFKEKIKELLDDSHIDWINKNIRLHQFYSENLHRLPEKSPSMIFHVMPEYEYETEDSKYLKKFQSKSDSLIDLKQTEISICDTIIKGGKQLAINYYKTSAASERIKTKLVQEMMEWFTTLP
jgi:hypothetical protein